jgi:enoyl-CoA hydratase
MGGALDLISACDMRYATKQAFFCVQEINLAMMADLGVLQRLPKLIPDGIARELVYTGDKLSAERALALGLLNAVFDTEEEMLSAVNTVAAKIAAKSPLAVSASKDSMNFSRDHGTQESLDHAAILQSAIIDADDISNAAKSAAQKKEASFAPLLIQSGL